MSSDDTIFNEQRFADMMENDLELMLEIILLAVDDLPKQLAQIHTAVSEKHWVQVGRIAHGIKGVCMSLCADQAQAAARRLEEFCSQGLEPADTDIKGLESCLASLVELLQSFHDQNTNSDPA